MHLGRRKVDRLEKKWVVGEAWLLYVVMTLLCLFFLFSYFWLHSLKFWTNHQDWAKQTGLPGTRACLLPPEHPNRAEQAAFFHVANCELPFQRHQKMIKIYKNDRFIFIVDHLFHQKIGIWMHMCHKSSYVRSCWKKRANRVVADVKNKGNMDFCTTTSTLAQRERWQNWGSEKDASTYSRPAERNPRTPGRWIPRLSTTAMPTSPLWWHPWWTKEADVTLTLQATCNAACDWGMTCLWSGQIQILPPRAFSGASFCCCATGRVEMFFEIINSEIHGFKKTR